MDISFCAVVTNIGGGFYFIFLDSSPPVTMESKNWFLQIVSFFPVAVFSFVPIHPGIQDYKPN